MNPSKGVFPGRRKKRSGNTFSMGGRFWGLEVSMGRESSGGLLHFFPYLFSKRKNSISMIHLSLMTEKGGSIHVRSLYNPLFLKKKRHFSIILQPTLIPFTKKIKTNPGGEEKKSPEKLFALGGRFWGLKVSMGRIEDSSTFFPCYFQTKKLKKVHLHADLSFLGD